MNKILTKKAFETFNHKSGSIALMIEENRRGDKDFYVDIHSPNGDKIELKRPTFGEARLLFTLIKRGMIGDMSFPEGEIQYCLIMRKNQNQEKKA